jgi:hypothetical protein
MAEKSKLHKLSELGQGIWIDFLSRDMLHSGELARMMKQDAVVGVTSNPTIFQKAISAGDAYDEQLRQVLTEERDPNEIFLRLAVQDVNEALDLLRPVWTGLRQGRIRLARGRPELAYDTEGTTAEAVRLHKLVDEPNLFARSGNEAGPPPIQDMIAKGKSINARHLPRERYEEVARAHIRGLERLVAGAATPALSHPWPASSSAVRRHRGGQAPRRGRRARSPGSSRANAKLAYQRQGAFSGET